MGKYVRYGRILLCLYISYCIHKQIIVSGIWTERKRCFLTASNSRKTKPEQVVRTQSRSEQ